jgi:O-antigen/teichoic acid export membrane protein
VPEPGDSLRRRSARGTIINASFLVAFAGLALIQRIVVARLLTPAEFGLWNVVLVAILTVLFLKNAGVGDKYVQQRESDQERAFQKAFTIDLALAVACVVVAAIVFPILAVVYGRFQIIVPGIVLSLAIVGNSLQAPVWIYYRNMNYARQRTLMAIDPVVTFVLTIALAAAGAGAWSLVVGTVVGAFSSGIVALKVSPYRPKLVWERGTVREYFSFSWPVVVAGGAGSLISQGLQIVATRTVGLRGAGGIGVGVSLSNFTDGVDGIVTQTLYPAICAVRDRADLLLETFIKSNRIALLWGLPFGVGVALFSSQLVHFVVGEQWRFAVHVIAAFGLVAGLNQLGFNWTAFLRALNLTRPMALIAVVQVVVFAIVTLPLFLAFGMDGLAGGWVAFGFATIASRTFYLRRVFPGFKMTRHAFRAMTPSIPAVAAVLAMRASTQNDLTTAHAAAQLSVYVAVTVVASCLSERALLGEVIGYLRPARPALS